MSKYADRLKRTKDQISVDSVTSAEQAAVFSVKRVILTAQEQLSKIAAAKEQALGANPFNIERVIELGKEEADEQATLAVAEQLLTEEFA